MFAIVALHVVAPAIFLYANITRGTVLGVRRNVIGSFRIVGTFGQPSPYGFTVCRGVVAVATLETKPRLTAGAHAVLGNSF
jgi:hypothetical protein